MSDLEEVSFPLHTFDGKQYIAVEDADVLRQLIEAGGRIDGELRAEIERLREALRNVVAYADLPQDERNWDLWELAVTHARSALEGGKSYG